MRITAVVTVGQGLRAYSEYECTVERGQVRSCVTLHLATNEQPTACILRTPVQQCAGVTGTLWHAIAH